MIWGEWIAASMDGRNKWGRSLLLLWTFWIGYHLLTAKEPSILLNPFYFFDHGIHELAHWVTRPFGMWVSIPAGSLAQILFPLVPIYALYRQSDLHGVFFLLTWEASSIFHVAKYAGSAAFSALDMWTPHQLTMVHDWVWMLTELNLYTQTWAPRLEIWFTSIAWLCWGASLLGQVLCLWFAWTKPNRAEY